MTEDQRAKVQALIEARQREAECFGSYTLREQWAQDVVATTAALVALLAETQWQDIVTAPKDGTYVLLHAPSQNLRPTVGRWDVQQHHIKPRPYWQTERGNLFGAAHDRRHQPTHWMRLPTPPETGDPTP